MKHIKLILNINKQLYRGLNLRKFFVILTGLAQSKVVSRTPIRGVTEIMRSVNLGKYSCANTAYSDKNIVTPAVKKISLRY